MFEKNDPRLTAYLLGESDLADQHWVEEALRTNSALKSELAELNAVISQVQTAFHAELDGTAIPQVRKESKSASDMGSRRGPKSWHPWALLAALLISLGGIGYWLVTPPLDNVKLGERIGKVGADVGGLSGGGDIDRTKATGPGTAEDLSLLSGPEARERMAFRILPLSDGVELTQIQDLFGWLGSQSAGEAEADSLFDRLGRFSAVPDQTAWPSLRFSVEPGEGTVILGPPEEEVRRFKELLENAGAQPGEQGLSGESNGLPTNPSDGQVQGRDQASTSDVDRPAVPGTGVPSARAPSAEDAQPAAEGPRTWRRVNATPNTSRLMVGNNDEMKLHGTQVQIHVDGFRARVIMDTFFYNDRSQILEGTFKLRLPDDASLFYLAFGDSVQDFSRNPKDEKEMIKAMQIETVSLQPDGIGTARAGMWQNVKEARLVTREKAAHAYQETVRRRVDPAVAEWAGAGVFQARVFPLQPNRMHRIVVGYDVNLQPTSDGLAWRFDLPRDAGFTQVEMSVDTVPGEKLLVRPAEVPVKRDHRHVYFWSNPAGTAIELTRSSIGPRVLVSPLPAADPLKESTNENRGGYFAAQFVADLPASAANTSRRAIFLLDTSLSSNPDKFNVWLKLMEQTLTQNRESLESFAVLNFGVDQHYWRPQYVANTTEHVRELLEDCQQLVLEGATDLHAAARLLHETPWLQDGGVPPDVFLLSDGAVTWGEDSAVVIRATLETANLGRLFAYQTGMSGTEVQTLRYLANALGGAVFSVANESEIEYAATAHRQRPWQIKALTVAGAADLLTAGRSDWLYPGQTVTIAGRGPWPGKVTLHVEQGETRHEIQVEFPAAAQGISDLAARVYGQIAVTQLEALGLASETVAAAYARHYQVAGQTCSLVMLESDADYQRFDIRPEDDWLMIQTQSAATWIERTIRGAEELLLNPNARLVHWLKRLQSTPGMSLELPPALQLVWEQIEVPVNAGRLNTSGRTHSEAGADYLSSLTKEEIDYDRVAEEAMRLAAQDVLGRADGAVKVWSNLIERSPADVELLRDVAWSLMELGRADHASGLLLRVARLRPFEGATYLALGNVLQQAGQADLAVVYYEVALGGTFQRTGPDFRQIVANDYVRLLQTMVGGHVQTGLAGYATARLESLRREFPLRPELTITLFWNTDRTDVDLHVTEPTAEVCNYQRRKTRSGGRITADVTTGFGPEMYWIEQTPPGTFQVAVGCHRDDQNRTKQTTRVLVSVVHRQKSGKFSASWHVARLDQAGQLQVVTTIEP